ncbi:MAG: serine/threonine protein kinase [Deltaproteobacteria bacterium]|nr:serine/threonine protein kinase [Deltaproteobacteria bacterium]
MVRPRRPGEHELAEGMRLLDRYSILDRIGSGGMATIYRATDDRLDRVVCVKLLRTTLVEGSGSNNTSGRAVYQATYSHFLQEALALSKLQHPNTLRIYDFGYLDEQSPDPGAPFFVAEYLDGGNLETHVRLRGPIPPDETLAILEGVCGAIAEAHEHNIIHRDIKPSNILFARIRGELVPKLADFGIAHSDLKKRPGGSFDRGPDALSTVALFSPRWAAPEQLCGSPEGPRTDVYALALLTMYMLTGQVFFGDEDVRVTFNDRVRTDTLVAGRLVQQGFTGELGRALTAALSARAEDRIATAPELFDRLREALTLRPAIEIGYDDAPPANRVVQQEPPPLPPPPPPSQPHLAQPSHASSRVPPSSDPHAQQGAHHAQPRASALALEVEAANESGARVAPPEQIAQYGERRVRFVQVHEKLDLSFLDREGGLVRVRVTMLPMSPLKLNIKGLTCFVGKRGQRPSPALTVTHDGAADLVSATRVVLGELTWSFGQTTPEGRVFVVDGRQLLVPYTEAREAVALMLGQGDDLVVMCRR